MITLKIYEIFINIDIWIWMCVYVVLKVNNFLSLNILSIINISCAWIFKVLKPNSKCKFAVKPEKLQINP